MRGYGPTNGEICLWFFLYGKLTGDLTISWWWSAIPVVLHVVTHQAYIRSRRDNDLVKSLQSLNKSLRR